MPASSCILSVSAKVIFVYEIFKIFPYDYANI